MRLLKLSEVAQLLRVPRARAYALARQGLIPTVRLGRQIRVCEQALKKFIYDGGCSLPSTHQEQGVEPRGPQR